MSLQPQQLGLARILTTIMAGSLNGRWKSIAPSSVLLPLYYHRSPIDRAFGWYLVVEGLPPVSEKTTSKRMRSGLSHTQQRLPGSRGHGPDRCRRCNTGSDHVRAGEVEPTSPTSVGIGCLLCWRGSRLYQRYRAWLGVMVHPSRWKSGGGIGACACSTRLETRTRALAGYRCRG